MALLVGFFKAIFGICETPALNAELWKMEGKRVAIRPAEATVETPAPKPIAGDAEETAEQAI